ncbi:FAD-binding oxidoreductase [Streptomyces sp. NPDC047860]|uniref:FAD-binding oxidoreductase n=1 Tax=Streptomyces sp. NPDC047860 TaxID=3155743 RepID=UPI0034046B6A
MSGLDTTALDNLRTALRGRVVAPQDPDYDEARSIYNAMIDRRPAAIAQCRGVADVRTTIAFAQETGVNLAVRGGGHSGPGLCLIDDGLTLDLAPMRWVRVDPLTETVQVGGGSQLGDLDHETHAFGLGVPSGINSTTGVGGLTLGGGHGHLTRKYGLTVDSLIGADVVLADGSVISVSEKEHPDLLWALRGGGGNFGVVTSLTYRPHPVDTVGVAATVWPVDRTQEVLRWYREFLPAAPDDLNGFFAIMAVPPGPPFPEPIHGRKMCAVIWCYTGDLTDGRLEDVLSVVNDPAPPAFHFTTPMPYPALQSMFDELVPKGLQWYWRGDFFDSIPDESLPVHERYGRALPTALSMMHLYPVDGAAHRVDPGETAWAYRDAMWSGVVAGIDPDPANADVIRQWCVDYWTDLHPFSMGGSYVNFLGEAEGPERVRSTYRDQYDRLTAVKRTYDPHNFFRANQNIPPSAA